jgi:hypothetical protein
MLRFRYHSRERGANHGFERGRGERGANHGFERGRGERGAKREALFVRLGMELA